MFNKKEFTTKLKGSATFDYINVRLFEKDFAQKDLGVSSGVLQYWSKHGILQDDSRGNDN